jgi:hypothetical protein
MSARKSTWLQVKDSRQSKITEPDMAIWVEQEILLFVTMNVLSSGRYSRFGYSRLV